MFHTLFLTILNSLSVSPKEGQLLFDDLCSQYRVVKITLTQNQ